MGSMVFSRYAPQLERGRKKPWRFRWKEFGKLHSKYFATEKEGDDFLVARERELMGFGEDAVSLEDRLLLRQLKLRAREAGLAMGDLLGEALAPRPAHRAITMGDALAAFELHNRELGLSSDMQSSYRWIVGSFARGREDLTLDRLTPEGVVGWLLSRYQNDVTRRTNRARLVTFFRFCAAPSLSQRPWDSRPWLGGDFADGIRWKHRRPGRSRPVFLRLAQIMDLMDAAPEVMRPCYALMTWAGIRPRELTRDDSVKKTAGKKAQVLKRGLQWEDFDFDRQTIHIAAEVSKTRDEWLLHDLPSNLWVWLKPWRGAKGPVWPHGLKLWKVMHCEVYRSIGMESWTRDVLRHSFASYGYWRGLEWVLDKMRHTKGATTFRDHYKGNATEAEGRGWAGIYPGYVRITGAGLPIRGSGLPPVRPIRRRKGAAVRS